MSLFRIYVIPVLLQFGCEVLLFIAQRLILLRILFQFLYILFPFRLLFLKNGTIGLRIIGHAVLDPALGSLADAVGHRNADGDLHEGNRNQRGQRGSHHRSPQGADKGQYRLLVQFHAINRPNFRNHVHLIGHQGSGAQKGSRHNDSSPARSPADETFRFLIPVINDVDFHIRLRRIHMDFFRFLRSSCWYLRRFLLSRKSGFRFFCRKAGLLLFHGRLSRFLHLRSCFRTNNRCLFHISFFAHRNLPARTSGP